MSIRQEGATNKPLPRRFLIIYNRETMLMTKIYKMELFSLGISDLQEETPPVGASKEL